MVDDPQVIQSLRQGTQVQKGRHDTQHNDIQHNIKVIAELSITTLSIQHNAFSVIMLSVANKPNMLSVVMLSVVMLSVITLSVIMLSVVMLNVEAPQKGLAVGLNE